MQVVKIRIVFNSNNQPKSAFEASEQHGELGSLTYSLTYLLTDAKSWKNLAMLMPRVQNQVCSLPGDNHQDSGRTKFLICLSVCQLTYFLTEIRQIWGYIQFLMRDLSDFFGNIFGILLHQFQICLNFLYVRQVCFLAYFLTERAKSW